MVSQQRIAERIVETFETRAEQHESDLCICPHVTYSSSYITVQMLDVTLWDTENENSQAENGETFETALAHAESVIRDVIVGLEVLIK